MRGHASSPPDTPSGANALPEGCGGIPCTAHKLFETEIVAGLSPVVGQKQRPDALLARYLQADPPSCKLHKHRAKEVKIVGAGVERGEYYLSAARDNVIS